MDQNIFPTSQQAQDAINQIDSIKWEEYDGKNLSSYLERTHRRLIETLGGYSLFLKHVQRKFPLKMKFFRVRELSEISDVNSLSEYSYPPANRVTKNLRANLIGHPVFYCSDHPLIALLEFIQQWDDPQEYLKKEYVISSWFMLEKDFKIAPFIPHSLIEFNPLSPFSHFSNEEFRQTSRFPIDDDRIEGVRMIKNYLSNLFLDDHKRTISSFLAHQYNYSGFCYPCIFIYPSLKFRHMRNNYALNPNLADNFLRLSHVYRVSVNSINEKVDLGIGFNYDVLDDFGINQNGAVKWISKNAVPSFEEVYKDEWELDLQTNIIG